MALSRRRLILGAWLLGYVALLAAIVIAMVRERASVLNAYSTQPELAAWQNWREDEKQRQTIPGPVVRKVPKSEEPPALVLMRDYFKVSLFGATFFTSLLYWIMAWFVTGALALQQSDRRMGSTIISLISPSEPQSLAAGSLRWRTWPLVDRIAWSWLLPVGIAFLGLFVFWQGGGLPLAIAAMVVAAISIWPMWLPTTFEVTSLGLRRKTPRRIRLIPWQAIRAYQLRTTGVMLFQQPEPSRFDVLSGLFVPYPKDADELVVALNLYVPHAIEMPR